MCVTKDVGAFVHDQGRHVCVCVMKGDACVNVRRRETHMYVDDERSVCVCV